MNNINNLSGLDKAGLLFQMLGESLALTLFNDMSESDLLKIRIRSKELKNISVSIKKEVLEEFYFKLLSNQNKNPERDSSEALFEFLNNLNNEQFFYLLANESSRVIALAVDQVSDKKKQNFFSRLDDPLQKNEVIMEIGNLDNIPLEAVVTIANDLKQKVAFILHTIFIWTAYVVMLWLTALAIPEMNSIGLSAVFACFIAGTFAIGATPGGIGLYPIMIASVLIQLYDYKPDIADSFGMLMWSTQTAFMIVLGLTI